MKRKYRKLEKGLKNELTYNKKQIPVTHICKSIDRTSHLTDKSRDANCVLWSVGPKLHYYFRGGVIPVNLQKKHLSYIYNKYNRSRDLVVQVRQH